MLGPSGCGKTTTLRMIAGLEDITRGEIYIGDRLVNQVHPKNRRIGLAFEDYALYPPLSVYNNIAFNLRAKGAAPGARSSAGAGSRVASEGRGPSGHDARQAVRRPEADA